MSQNYGLGRGLASLIPPKNQKTEERKNGETGEMRNNLVKSAEADHGASAEKNKTGGVLEVDINLIDSNPHQPRLGFDEEKLEALAQSIKSHGIIQPIIVTKSNDRYELIAGERRFLGAKKAGLQKVPVIVREAQEKEKLELALIENVQRHDLNPVEEAKAYKKLALDFEMSQEEVADRVGKSRSAVANKIRLLNLPVEIQRSVIEGKITEGHAKAILAMPNPEKQRALYEMIIKQNLTVRQVEDKTKEVSVRSHKRTVNIDPEIKELENKLVGFLGTKVKVTKSGGGGRIVIEYYSKEELDNIIGKLI
jgi:ParB family transcriptional regulator, chromosome partitioning protein